MGLLGQTVLASHHDETVAQVLYLWVQIYTPTGRIHREQQSSYMRQDMVEADVPTKGSTARPGKKLSSGRAKMMVARHNRTLPPQPEQG